MVCSERIELSWRGFRIPAINLLNTEEMAPRVEIEPTTAPLTAGCSPSELPRKNRGRSARGEHFVPCLGVLFTHSPK